jgi:predicted lipoprotein
MKEIEEMHRRAMELAERSDAAGGDVELLRQAFELERAAALLAEERKIPQPSLAILFRSAASLAAECGSMTDAQALASQALSWQDQLPDDLVAELREIISPSTRSAP